jgi:hypothetical protein
MSFVVRVDHRITGSRRAHAGTQAAGGDKALFGPN